MSKQEGSLGRNYLASLRNANSSKLVKIQNRAISERKTRRKQRVLPLRSLKQTEGKKDMRDKKGGWSGFALVWINTVLFSVMTWGVMTKRTGQIENITTSKRGGLRYSSGI